MINNSGNLRSASSYALPIRDIRKAPPSRTPWRLWLELGNEEIAKCYNVLVTRVLSNYQGIHLDDIRRLLKHKYCFSHEIVEKFIMFIIKTPTIDIEFEHHNNNIRKPIIYKAPRLHAAAVGEFCVFMPDSRLKASGYGEK